jgi:Tol biopolymer transport system component
MHAALVGVLGLSAISSATAAHASSGPAASSTLIAFDTRYSGDVSQISTVHPDGTGLTQLTHSPSRGSWDPAFSPDGSQIAFAVDGSTGGRIALMRIDGSDRHRVLRDVGNDDYAPAWTPDGSAIVFVRCHHAPGYPCRIAQMNVDGTQLVELTHGYWHDGAGPFGIVPGELGPAVSEEDGRIAFSSDRGGYDTRLFVMDADGSNRHVISKPAVELGDPSWSHEAQWISGTGNPEIGTTYLVHPDGSDLHEVEVGVLFATFSPTGTQLVGLEEASGMLVTFAAEGGAVTTIPGTLGATFTDWSFAS